MKVNIYCILDEPKFIIDSSDELNIRSNYMSILLILSTKFRTWSKFNLNEMSSFSDIYSPWARNRNIMFDFSATYTYFQCDESSSVYIYLDSKLILKLSSCGIIPVHHTFLIENIPLGTFRNLTNKILVDTYSIQTFLCIKYISLECANIRIELKRYFLHSIIWQI